MEFPVKKRYVTLEWHQRTKGKNKDSNADVIEQPYTHFPVTNPNNLPLNTLLNDPDVKAWWGGGVTSLKIL